MVLSHSAIKRKRRSSWSSPPPVVQPPTTPPRTVRRKKPKSLGFLADQDPKLAGKTLTEARKINNARIAQIVARFAGTPPPLEPPHHKSHPVGLRVCVGTGVQNYKSIGKWVQYVCTKFIPILFRTTRIDTVQCDPNQDGSCHKNVKLIGNGIDEEVLLNTKPLTQYLFIHLEIGPHPGPGARTIKNSPLYAAARARLYGTLPPQEAPGPTVPQHEAGPSHSPKKEQMEIPLTDAQSCPSVDRHVIEISDDESGVHPVIVFAWVKVSFLCFISESIHDLNRTLEQHPLC